MKHLAAYAMVLLFVAGTASAELILHYSFDTQADSNPIVDESNSSSQNNDAVYGGTNDDNIGPIDDDLRGSQVFKCLSTRSIAVGNTGGGIAAPNVFTIAGWFRGTDNGYFFDQLSPRFVLSIERNVSGIGAYFGGWHAAPTYPVDMNDGAWHHLVVSVSNNGTDAQFTFHLDGTDAGTVTATGKGKASLAVQATTGKQRFASNNGGSADHLNGSYDDLRIYDTALSSAEATALYNATILDGGAYPVAVKALNPIEYFRCNSYLGEYGSTPAANQLTWGDTSGVSLSDSGGFSGFYDGNLWCLVDSVNRTYWTSAPVNTMTMAAGTCIAWINPSFTGDSDQVFLINRVGGSSTSYNGNKMWSFHMSKTGALGVSVDGQSLNTAGVLNTGTDQWFMVAVTWEQSSGTIRLYLNGTAVSSTTSGGWDDTGAMALFYMGKEMVSGNYNYEGYIDEVAIWTTVLPASDIAELYNHAAEVPVTVPKGTIISIR
jgi:hypothetical protein